jgi:hypothetical protein
VATALAQLSEVPAARARLDEQELELIDRARYAGATWTQIAAVLGLTSRQAAQQRHQRLVAGLRSRQEVADRRYAPGIVALRGAVAALYRWIRADRRWDARFVRAALVRETVTAALDAPPGALYALAAHISADLDGAGRQRLPRPVRAAAADLHEALSMKH